MKNAFLLPLAVLVFCAFILGACDMAPKEPTGPQDSQQTQ